MTATGPPPSGPWCSACRPPIDFHQCDRAPLVPPVSHVASSRSSRWGQDDNIQGARVMKRIGLACLVVVAAANGASADTLADCSRGRNSDVRLRACSDVIAGPAYGPDEKALAYRNRGNARADAGASAQAVADFNQAIRLRPDDASAYAGRARAKLALRDVAAAIDDYDAALRLTPATPATASLRRTGPCALRQGRPGGGNCRLHGGDPAQSKQPERLQSPRPRLPQVRRPGARDRRLHRGYRAQSRLRARLQQPRLRLRSAGPQAGCDCRFPVGAPARSLADRRPRWPRPTGNSGGFACRDRNARARGQGARRAELQRLSRGRS